MTAQKGEPSGSLKTLDFSDLYLEPDGRAWFKNSPNDRQRHSIESEAGAAEIAELRRQLQEHRTGLDFRTEWDGIGLRVERINTLEGDVYVCRRLLKKPIAFEKLGMPPKLQESLLSEHLKQGLVLFTGGTGSGKSMSQSSWLVARLARFGGTACTVENPIEIVLQGEHGFGDAVGTCYQTEVQSENEYGPAIQRMLRAAPNIIMLGEIRSKEAAAQAVLAGTSGHIVTSTVHGSDVQTCLERIKNMLRGSGLDESMLGEALAGVIHQSMTTYSFGESTRARKLSVTPLMVAGSPSETAIRANLRTGDFSQLSSEIDRQKRSIYPELGGKH